MTPHDQRCAMDALECGVFSEGETIHEQCDRIDALAEKVVSLETERAAFFPMRQKTS